MALESRHQELLTRSEKLFTDRKPLESLWQDIALQFYPEMAEFTSSRAPGTEYADHLSSSYPMISRRTLGDSLGALLRPVNLDSASPGVWFSMRAGDRGAKDSTATKWLEWATGIMRRAMYHRASGFVRAAREGDHMFATFGQAPLSIELNKAGTGLLYRALHLRDVAWIESAEGNINWVCRKWKPTAAQLKETFGDKVAAAVATLKGEDVDREISCYHIVIAAKDYDSPEATPWVSLWIDADNQHVMEETGSWSRKYIIPRWVTVPGSQYASSPAVTAALPDARLIQAMTLTLLESAEKFADPPMVATQEAVKGGVELFSGGVTWVDAEYDEKLGDALRPLYHPAAGQGAHLGLQIRADVRQSIDKAFFLDSLSLPPADMRNMTAFEVGQRMSEWIRRAMPIFEPMEFEYNGVICEETFDLLMRNGGFGNLDDLPESLTGADVTFGFESPLHESAERKKSQKFLEAKSVLAEASSLDPKARHMVNASDALRDVLGGIGVPSSWTRDDAEMEKLAEKDQQNEGMQELLSGGGQAAGAAKDLGAAVKQFAAAGLQP